MRITILVGYYPTPFKPYFDDQFAELIDSGHEIAIYASGRIDETRAALVDEYRLESRVRRYPVALRSVPAALPRAALAAARVPDRFVRLVRATLQRPGAWKERGIELVRHLGLASRRLPDLVLVHGVSTLQMFRNIRSILPSVPVALFYHGGEVTPSDPVADATDLLAVPHVIFSGSEFAGRELIARGAPAERIRSSPLGFRLQHFAPDPGRPYLQDGALRCLTVGRLSVEKGHAVMLAALALLPDALRARVRWRVIGSGPEERALRNRTQELGLSSQVTFLGALPRPAVIDALRRTDCLVLPSVPTPQWAESQACVLQESLLMAVPVLAARLGGVPESTAPGCRELLFEPGDAAALAQRLALLLAWDAGRFAALGDAGRVWARTNYDVRIRTEELVAEALRSCAPGGPTAGP